MCRFQDGPFDRAGAAGASFRRRPRPPCIRFPSRCQSRVFAPGQRVPLRAAAAGALRIRPDHSPMLRPLVEPPPVREALSQYRRLLVLLRPYWGSLVRSALLGLVIGLVAMAPPYLSKLLIDEVYTSRDGMLMEVLVVSLLVLGVTV